MEIYEFLETSAGLDLNWLGLQIISIISENEENLLYLLGEQWERGQNEDGKAVGRYKWSTENFYAIVDPPLSGLPKREGQPYNLKWHGSLFRELSIKFEFGNEDLFLLIDSSASTKDPLFRQIRSEGLVDEPESIFGFQEVNLGKISELTNEEVIKKFYSFLKLN